MKHIMISIRPEWTEKILNGEKTLEIRKTRPKCEYPCLVYIYETKSKWMKPYYNSITGRTVYNECEGRGKVIGVFLLEKAKEYYYYHSPAMFISDYYNDEEKQLDYRKCCLTKEQLYKYADDGKILPKPIYAWHIDNLEIYKKPKELIEFGLMRPFQSWGYLKDEI